MLNYSCVFRTVRWIFPSWLQLKTGGKIGLDLKLYAIYLQPELNVNIVLKLQDIHISNILLFNKTLGRVDFETCSKSVMYLSRFSLWKMKLRWTKEHYDPFHILWYEITHIHIMYVHIYIYLNVCISNKCIIYMSIISNRVCVRDGVYTYFH